MLYEVITRFGNLAREQSEVAIEVTVCGPYRTAKSPGLNPGNRLSISGMLKVNLVRMVLGIEDLIISCCCIAFPQKTIRSMESI